MKVTIDIPDNVLAMTYQYVHESETYGSLIIQQKVLDSNTLNEFRRENEDENA